MKPRILLLGLVSGLLLSACAPKGNLSVELKAPNEPVEAYVDAPLDIEITNDSNQDISQITVMFPEDFFSDFGGIGLAHPEADLDSKTSSGDQVLSWDVDLAPGDTFSLELNVWGVSENIKGTIEICAPEFEDMCVEEEISVEIEADPSYVEADLSDYEITLDLPETMQVGIPSEAKVKVTNTGDTDGFFYSVDIGDEFTNALDFDCMKDSAPACSWEPYTYPYNGYTYLAVDYYLDLAAGDSVDLTMTFTPKTAGEYTFPFDICVGDGNVCQENKSTVTITE